MITSRGARSRVEPRVVVAGDENRLTGYAALPLHHNPYVDEFGEPALAAGAVRPAPGTYHVVFDSPDRAGAGSFRFRFWIDDISPPTAKLIRRTVPVGEPLRVRVGDAGSGVDARSIEATLGGRTVAARLHGDELRIPTRSLAPGRYRLRVEVADHQETRNNENVPRILPNTRVLSTHRDDPPRRVVSRSLRPGLLGRRQRVEVALNALDELVVVRRDDPQLRLAPLAVAPTPGIRTHDARDPRPFGGDNHQDAEREQDDPRPAHAMDSTRPVVAERSARPRRVPSPRNPRGGR